MNALTPNRPVWQLLDSRAIGGIETHVAALSTGLRTAGVDARVLLLKDHGPHPLEEILSDGACPVTKLDGRFPTLLRQIRGARPAVLHTHGYKAGILGRLAGRLAGVPTVSTFHNGDDGVGVVRFYTALDRFTSVLGERVSVNAAIASRLPGRVHVVENGVPLPERPAEGSGTRVAFVGRLSEEKGPDTFVELAARFPGLQFDMFGDGAMRERIDPMIGSVTHRGAVPSMAPYWSDIGLLVMPSRAEGLPMAALEAMAHGIPVAAFDVGALGKLTASDRGWCVAPGDADALANAIDLWSRESVEERRQRAAINARFVASHYSMERMVGDMLAIYRNSL